MLRPSRPSVFKSSHAALLLRASCESGSVGVFLKALKDYPGYSRYDLKSLPAYPVQKLLPHLDLTRRWGSLVSVLLSSLEVQRL